MNALVVLLYIQAGFMFAALPLSLFAAYGFRGTPWGRVLTPLPVMEVAFSVGLGISILDGGGDWLLVQAVAYGIGVLAVSLISFHLARLATGGVRT